MDDLLGITPAEGGCTAAMCAVFAAIFITGALLDALAVFSGRIRELDGPDLLSRLRSRSWSLPEAAWLILVLAVGYLAMCAAVSLAPRTAPTDPGPLSVLILVAHTLCLPALAIGAIFLLLRSKRIPFRTAFGAPHRHAGEDLRQGLLFYVMAMPVVGFYSLVYLETLRVAGIPTTTPQEVVRIMLSPEQPLSAQIYLAGLAVFVAPVSEELLFRGILLPLAARHSRMPVAVTLVSVAFAAMHGHLPSMMPLFLIAVAFSLGYLYTGSIGVPIVMHAAFNAVSILTMVLMNSGQP